LVPNPPLTNLLSKLAILLAALPSGAGVHQRLNHSIAPAPFGGGPRGTDEEVGTLPTKLIGIEEGLLSGLAAKAELRELLDELYDDLE
jgi:hypothetical protein